MHWDENEEGGNSLKLNTRRITFPLPAVVADAVSDERMVAGTATGWPCTGTVLSVTLSDSSSLLPISPGFMPGLKGVTNFAGVLPPGVLCNGLAIDPDFVGVLKPAAPLMNPPARDDRTEVIAGPLIGALARG